MAEIDQDIHKALLLKVEDEQERELLGADITSVEAKLGDDA